MWFDTLEQRLQSIDQDAKWIEGHYQLAHEFFREHQEHAHILYCPDVEGMTCFCNGKPDEYNYFFHKDSMMTEKRAIELLRSSNYPWTISTVVDYFVARERLLNEELTDIRITQRHKLEK